MKRHATIVAAAFLAALTGHLSAQAATPSTLSGSWTYNAEQSDNAGEYLPSMNRRPGQDSGRAGPPLPPPGGGGRGGFGGPGGGAGGEGGRGGFGGGMGGGGTGGPGGREFGRAGRAGAGVARGQRGTMQLASTAPLLLRIGLTDSTVFLSGTDSVTMRPRMPDSTAVPMTIVRRDSVLLSLGGKKVKHEYEGNEIELSARMDGGRLVVERKVSGGGKVTETYFRSREGKLFVIVKVEISALPKPVEFRRIYDPAADMEAAPSC
jgi:hypothetical protein